MATNKQSNWQQFVATATKIAKKEGFPVGVLLGQAALESARGTAAPGNNYFGIKGTGSAGTQNLATQEFGNGGYYGTNSGFRAYNSPEESIKDYINLIKTEYPKAWAVKDNPQAMLQAIHQGGYATDPAYVSSVMNTPEFKAEHGNLQELASAAQLPQQDSQPQQEQSSPVDQSANFPTVQNPASQGQSYPLRDALSNMDVGAQQTGTTGGGSQPMQMPSTYRQSLPITYGQVAPLSYDYGGQLSQPPQSSDSSQAPSVPVVDPNQPQQQTTDPNAPQYQQPAPQTYKFGPITITS